MRFDFLEKKKRNFTKHSFDVVAENGNNVEATFDFVERIVRRVAFDNVASTLSLRQCCLNIFAGVDGALGVTSCQVQRHTGQQEPTRRAVTSLHSCK